MFPQKISTVIVNAGFSSSRAVRSFLRKHIVEVNDKKIEDAETLCDTDTDEIKIDGKKIDFPSHVYVMFNKPSGVVCSTVSDRHKVIYDFFPETIRNKKFLPSLHSVGRLDSETEGLLLLTTNGSFSNYISSPENKIPKKYFVRLENNISLTEQHKYAELAMQGLLLPPEKKFSEQKISGSEIEFLSENECYVTVTQGVFHEVRRIFLALGNKVVYLKRIAVGNVFLDEDLRKGEWRALTAEELSTII